MRMSDFVVRDAIVPELGATSKEAIARMIDKHVSSGAASA